ncbi:MAG: glycosyltransferase family 4 protein, partial [Bdellovibrionota bacterium]
SVPPQLYGGTERVVAYLSDALIQLGHEVTLFASGDSRTTARLRAPCRRALRLDTACTDQTPQHVLEMEMVASEADSFDIIHFHTDLLHLPMARRLSTPSLTTLHGRLDIPDLKNLYYEFRELPLVSISDNQRLPLPFVNWVKTIHHGLPLDLLDFHPQQGSYLAFLGRISAEKRVDRAIEIARLAGKKLKVAAKVDKADSIYYGRVKHLLKLPHVEFVGEITESQKSEFLGNAEALLFPIDWPEPFGLVMIEAMATGTPVIAYPSGSVPEIIQNGVNGYIVNSIDSAVAAVEKARSIPRESCRASFEKNFSANRMAADYIAVYESLINKKSNVVALHQSSSQALPLAAGWSMG